jgi:hypothetical protein
VNLHSRLLPYIVVYQLKRLAALHSGAHCTVMPAPSAKLCRHRLGSQNIIREEGVFGENVSFLSFSKPRFSED